MCSRCTYSTNTEGNVSANIAPSLSVSAEYKFLKIFNSSVVEFQQLSLSLVCYSTILAHYSVCRSFHISARIKGSKIYCRFFKTTLWEFSCQNAISVTSVPTLLLCLTRCFLSCEWNSMEQENTKTRLCAECRGVQLDMAQLLKKLVYNWTITV